MQSSLAHLSLAHLSLAHLSLAHRTPIERWQQYRIGSDALLHWMEFYIWQGHRCVYDQIDNATGSDETARDETAQNETPQSATEDDSDSPALLLIHPIGVGLSRAFWQPFIEQWQASPARPANRIYNVDLLGCGDSEMLRQAYRPKDWAAQLAYFIEQVAKRPVVLIVQGALLPVAVELTETSASTWVKGLVLSGPPAWPLMTTQTPEWKTQLAWLLLSSPFGNLFYRYARREQFLRSFSERQLFQRAEAVSDRWLTMLYKGSSDMDSRFAVFSFLAGFWRQDYSNAIARIQQPVLIVMGEAASTIDRSVAKAVDQPSATDSQPIERQQKRLQAYLDHFPRAEGVSISGRNVPPYEATDEFVKVVIGFVDEL